MAGSAPGSGFTATMTNETLADRIFNLSNNHPDMAQWLSSILGNVVNNVLKKEASVGAATAQYSLKWNLIGDGHPDEKIVSVALGIDHHSYGHASLIFGFSGGGYEEVNYGRYGAVPHYLSVASPVGEGVYAFDYKYYLGKDDKTLYFLNINANDAAYVYNSMIEGNGYYKYDKYGQPNKSLKIGRDVNNNLIWAGDVYRKIETEDDYILWEWNCLTSSVYPLTYVSSKDNYYLNSLANRIAPDSANWVLQRDYEQYRGGRLVAWI